MSAIVNISSDFSFSFKGGAVLFSTGGHELLLDKGKIYGIFGSNGVGKTTLLNVINTVLRPPLVASDTSSRTRAMCLIILRRL